MNFITCSQILNEIGLIKKLATKGVRAMVGRKLPRSMRIKIAGIDEMIANLKAGKINDKVANFANMFGIDVNKNSEGALKRLYKMRSDLIGAYKEDRNDMVKKVALYGAVPPIAFGAAGIGASYHAAKKYAPKENEIKKTSPKPTPKLQPRQVSRLPKPQSPLGIR